MSRSPHGACAAGRPTAPLKEVTVLAELTQGRDVHELVFVANVRDEEPATLLRVLRRFQREHRIPGMMRVIPWN